MAEYIDKDRLKKEFLDWFCNGTNDVYIFINDILMFIDETEIADVAEVKHGKWDFPIFTDSEDGLDPRVKCSVCGGVEAAFVRWKYCPNCGARMDGEEK